MQIVLTIETLLIIFLLSFLIFKKVLSEDEKKENEKIKKKAISLYKSFRDIEDISEDLKEKILKNLLAMVETPSRYLLFLEEIYSDIAISSKKIKKNKNKNDVGEILTSYLNITSDIQNLFI